MRYLDSLLQVGRKHGFVTDPPHAGKAETLLRGNAAAADSHDILFDRHWVCRQSRATTLVICCC